MHSHVVPSSLCKSELEIRWKKSKETMKEKLILAIEEGRDTMMLK